MIELTVKKRDPKNSNDFLRSQGRVPAVIYGSGFENVSVSLDDSELRKVYKKAGMSNVVTLKGDTTATMCIIQDMQVHVVSGDILHVDLKVVNEGETTEVTIPLTLVGESPAIKNSIGLLNFSLEEIIIETIPSKIPQTIEVDISELNNLGDSVKLSDLKFSKDIKVLDDMNTTIVSIVSPREEEPEDAATDTPMEPELVDQKGKAKDESEDDKMNS